MAVSSCFAFLTAAFFALPAESARQGSTVAYNTYSEAAACNSPLLAPPLPGVWQANRPKFVFAQDIDWPPYAYLGSPPDSDYGVAGIGHDVVKAMGEMCEWDVEVVQADWSECWVDDRVQSGLKDGHFHACLTYTHTVGSRPRQMEFTNAFLENNKPAGILTRLSADGTPVIPSGSNLSGYKIADVNGWAPTSDGLALVNNQCTGERMSGYELVVPEKEGNDAALKLLLDGTVDGVWIYADQAHNYPCEEGGQEALEGDWDCSMWSGFGKTFAYVQTGLYGSQINGTTIGMSKKGSGIKDIINPCLQDFLKTHEYYEICKKHGLVSQCYANSFFPDAGESDENYWEYPTNELPTTCAEGYCPCA